jgi:hypothetical protein
MVVNYNDIINAIAKAEDVALYNARSRAIELSNGCKPSAADNEKAIEIESWIQILTRAAATIDEDTCLDDDIIWEIIQNINEQNREVDCDVSRAYSRHASSGGGSNVPYGYVERVLGLYVDNSNPRKPVIRIYVNPATISGDGTQADPFSAIGGGGGAVASVNGQTGVVVLTTTNIAEGTNLYYTNARGIASILTGFSAAAGTVLATDTILQAINKIVGNIANKQDTLVSGTNIKTINGNSLLGGGNLVISGTGDVVGPASSVNDRVVFFDGVTGKLIKDSGLTLSGTNTGNETAATIGAIVNGAAAATPNDTDLVATVESSVVKKITWTNVKAFLKTYFDAIYTTTAAVATQITTALSGYLTAATAAATYETIANVALKANIASPTFTGTVTTPAIIVSSETASRIAIFDASKNVKSADTATYPSLTELAYVKNLGSQAVGTSDTNTLTNKRITARTGTTTSLATPTINTDNVDFYSLTAQTVDITSFTTNLSGTPTEGQTLWIAITGTAARAITWGSSFEASTIALPTTTVTTNRLDVAFIWNSISSKWRCVGSV